MSIKSKLESLLFAAIKPLSLSELATALTCSKEEVRTELDELTKDYKEREAGISLVSNNSKYQLTTASINAELIKDFLKSEVSGELSQPSLEALTIIAYRGPISKMELERIRGVNCSLIIRNLLLRGLIEEKFDKSKQVSLYNVSIDFVKFLGMNNISELPDFDKLNQAESLLSVLKDLEEIN
ncbi:MAG TPA: SMC-Scp complex subunit ScpB [Patescibacteria group bacterium]|nr:SMC-Scp complex subunit ScpB [Patescibacteria group bacterium]